MISLRTIYIPDATIHYAKNYLSTQEADALFRQLEMQIPWRQDHLTLFGRRLAIPRLQAWIGDPECHYQYSGISLTPEPWPSALTILRQQIQKDLGEFFNAVLCNLYRNGQDHVGWHADDEPELEPHPCIACLSFGGARRLRMKHRIRSELKESFDLPSGSLFVMSGVTQNHWLHQIAKTARPVPPRISLTFRNIRHRKAQLSGNINF